MKARQIELDIPRQTSKDDPRIIDDLAAPPTLFRCLYVDPPWEYECKTIRGHSWTPYETLSIEELKNLPLPATEEAHLWLWTTWPMLRDCAPQDLVKAWGFRWVGEIVWVKDGLGIGCWLRPSTEILILAVRGDLKLLRNNQRGHFLAPRRGHSAKPLEVYELIESLSPGPRVELFSRSPRKGWYRWGHGA